MGTRLAAAGASPGGLRRTEEAGERVPLADVVSDCTRRWFQDALKEALGGDAAMQALVGQMYRSGYGVAKNEHEARIWMEKAAKCQSTLGPGNASDFGSEDSNANVK